jgi:hypothetical protein
MDFFDYQNGRLFAEQVDLQELAATYGTPLYVYSRATLERHWTAFDQALGEHRHLVCYALTSSPLVNWRVSYTPAATLAKWFFPVSEKRSWKWNRHLKLASVVSMSNHPPS